MLLRVCGMGFLCAGSNLLPSTNPTDCSLLRVSFFRVNDSSFGTPVVTLLSCNTTVLVGRTPAGYGRNISLSVSLGGTNAQYMALSQNYLPPVITGLVRPCGLWCYLVI